MKRRSRVDLRKRHPLHREIGKAIAIAVFGVLVDLAGVGEFIYFHSYTAAFEMLVAGAITAGALWMLCLIRRVYPLSLYEAWAQRLVRRHRATHGAAST